jgi:hypothetical protein
MRRNFLSGKGGEAGTSVLSVVELFSTFAETRANTVAGAMGPLRLRATQVSGAMGLKAKNAGN